MRDDRIEITTPSERQVRLRREFRAPRERVFDAWTRPELLRRWYGPKGWTLEQCEVDLREGGRWRFVTLNPEGRRIGQHGVYREIVRPERIVNTERWEDWDPGEVVVHVELEEREGRTTLTSTMTFPSPEVRDLLLRSGMTEGFGESCAKLDELLLDVVVTRAFDATPDQVWRAWTEAALVRRWWGPRGFTCPRAELDVRPGGTSRVTMRAPEAFGGFELHNSWTYGEVSPPERLGFVLRFCDAEGRTVDPASLGIAGVPLEVPHELTFRPLPDGRAELVVVERGYATPEAVAQSTLGLEQCLDKLAEALAPEGDQKKE